jgi:hypothetical protein
MVQPEAQQIDFARRPQLFAIQKIHQRESNWGWCRLSSLSEI